MVEERMSFLEGANRALRTPLRWVWVGRMGVHPRAWETRTPPVPVPLDSFLSEPGHSYVLVDLRQVQTPSHQLFLPSDSEGPEFQESSPAEGGPAGSPGAPAHAGIHKPEGRPLPDGACESS